MGVLMRGGLLLSPVAVVVAVAKRGGQSSSLRFSPSSPLRAEEDPTYPYPPDEPADEEVLPAHEAGISLAHGHEDEISTPRQFASCGSVTLLADHGDAPQQTPSSSRATATLSPVPATNTITSTTHRTEAEAALTLPDIFRRVTQLAIGGDYEQAVRRALHFQQLHQRMHYADVELLETSTEDQHRDHTLMLHALRAFLAAAVRSSHSHFLSRSSSSSLRYLPMPHALLSRAFLQTGRGMRFVQKPLVPRTSYHCPQWGPNFKSVEGNAQPIKGSFLAPRPQRSILRKEYYVGNYQHWKFQGLPVLGVYSGGSAGGESFPRVFAGRSNVDVMSAGPRYDEDEGAGAAEGDDSTRTSFGASWENYALAFDANRRHSEKKHRYRFSSAPVTLSELDEKLQDVGTARDDTWLVFESPAVFTVVQCEYDGTDAARPMRRDGGGIIGLDPLRILAGCEATVCRVDET